MSLDDRARFVLSNATFVRPVEPIRDWGECAWTARDEAMEACGTVWGGPFPINTAPLVRTLARAFDVPSELIAIPKTRPLGDVDPMNATYYGGGPWLAKLSRPLAIAACVLVFAAGLGLAMRLAAPSRPHFSAPLTPRAEVERQLLAKPPAMFVDQHSGLVKNGTSVACEPASKGWRCVMRGAGRAEIINVR